VAFPLVIAGHRPRREGGASSLEISAGALAECRTPHYFVRLLCLMLAHADTLVWTIGQSFNALAVRAPTSFVRSDPETAALKVRAYGEDIWNNGNFLTF
jgi:hypothetical protein